MAELRSAIFWVLNCPIYLLRCYKQIPGKVLIEINKKIGFRLITKAGEKGVINLMKLVPLVGGIVGGSFDGIFVNTCGKNAKRVFHQESDI